MPKPAIFLGPLIAWARPRWKELLVSASLFVGWFFLTAAIASLTSRVAWLFSIGVIGVCLAGIKFTATLFWQGLYTLAAGEVKPRG